MMFSLISCHQISRNCIYFRLSLFSSWKTEEIDDQGEMSLNLQRKNNFETRIVQSNANSFEVLKLLTVILTEI